jgi:glycosyltransferase involved in cell wall biosynthesis
MAMGKPVLVSDYAGLSENIDNNQDGWVVKQKSTSQTQKFLQRIEELDLSEFSNSANKKSKQEFGLKHFIDKTLEIYS